MASSINHVHSILVKKESSFGSLVNNFPDKTIFNSGAKSVAFIDAYSNIGEPVLNEDTTNRLGFYKKPADVATTVDSNGDWRPRRRGEFTITIDALMAPGATDSDTYWLLWMLASSMADSGKPGAGSEEATANAAAQTFEPEALASYTSGQLIATALVGRRIEVASVCTLTDAATDLVAYTPAFSSELDADIVHLMRTYAPSTSIGESLAFRFDGDKTRTYAFGCRLSNLELSFNETRAQLALTFNAALIFDDHAAVTAGNNWSTVIDLPAGKVLHALDCELVLSDIIDITDGAFPRTSGRTSIDVETATFSCPITLTPIPSSTSILGMVDMLPTDYDPSLTVTSKVLDDETHRDLLDKNYRNLAFGLAPLGAGNGFGLVFPAAFTTVDTSNYDYSEVPGVAKQNFTWKAGRVTGETASTIANTAFRLGFVDSGT